MGTAFLVGAGPGEKDLITVKGLELVKNADVLIYDNLISDSLLDETKPSCIKIYVGKSSGHHSKKQSEINEILIDCTKKYHMVVRLKGGDPFVFGRGGEEVLALQAAGLRFKLIPGVTSAVAVPENVGIPVTHRLSSRSFHVITGHTADHHIDFSQYAALNGTLVFLMGLSGIETLTGQLMDGGMDGSTPAAVISRGFSPDERKIVGTLSDIAQKARKKKILPPSIIVIGETAAYDFTYRHHSLRLGTVGTDLFCSRLKSALNGYFADVTRLCKISLVINEAEKARLTAELENIFKYSWLVFASQNAVKLFFDIADEISFDRRRLSDVKFAVIGSATAAALKKYGYIADLVPESFTSLAVAEMLKDYITNGQKILSVRAVTGTDEMDKVFEKHHITCNKMTLYDSVGTLTYHTDIINSCNCIVFASASGVRRFFEELAHQKIVLNDHIDFICIGKVTADELTKHGISKHITADIHNVDGIIKELERRYEI